MRFNMSTSISIMLGCGALTDSSDEEATGFGAGGG